jgi:hypothetical protein
MRPFLHLKRRLTNSLSVLLKEQMRRYKSFK